MSYHSLIGYGFRVFIRETKKIEKLKNIVQDINIRNNCYITFNHVKMRNNFDKHSTSKIFLSVDRFRNKNFNTIVGNELISCSQSLLMYVSETEIENLKKLQNEVHDLGVIYDNNLGWYFVDYKN